ncbi:MAG: cell division protein FtsA [Sphingomicrobium sp.]
MAAPAEPQLTAALDIGSSKVSAIIASIDGAGGLTVLGTGQRESRGVKRGYITDMGLSEFAVREAVELAERMSGRTVDEVLASYGAGGLVSDVANVEVELGGHAIEQADIDELMRNARLAIKRDNQVVLHAHPALYTIDRAQGVQQPIGLFANRLGVDIHVIAADDAPLRNIDRVIRSAHLDVQAVVASPIAAALACLSEEERELGVALVELGADVTNVSVHMGGMLVGLRSIPLGAHDITNDIACAFAVQRRDAERLKCFYGSAMTSPRDNHEMIEASQIAAEPGAEPIKITRAQLMMVIRQRIEELTGAVESALKEMGFTGPVGRQVVLTGGGAELKNIADYMQGVLGRAVRVGRPRQIAGLPDAHSGPAFSTLVGLALLAAAETGDIRDPGLEPAKRPRGGSGMLSRLVTALRKDY